MAFVGAWETWEIPYVFVSNGYLEESESEGLCDGPLIEAERKLRWYVRRLGLKFVQATGGNIVHDVCLSGRLSCKQMMGADFPK